MDPVHTRVVSMNLGVLLVIMLWILLIIFWHSSKNWKDLKDIGILVIVMLVTFSMFIAIGGLIAALSGYIEAAPRAMFPYHMEYIKFESGKMTTFHRNPVVEQMVCSGENCIHVPYAIYEYRFARPHFGMPLPEGVTVGDYNIVCEPWDDSGNGLVATNTCQVRYTLIGKPMKRGFNIAD